MDLLAALDAARAAPPVSDVLALVQTDAAPASAVQAGPVVHPAPPARPCLRRMLQEQHAAEPDRLPWPDDWFDRTDSGQISACRALWCEILRMLLMDVARAHANRRSVPGAPTSVPWHLHGNDGWLGSRDALIVAALAGFDPEALVGRVRAAIATPDGATALCRALGHGERGRNGHAAEQ